MVYKQLTKFDLILILLKLNTFLISKINLTQVNQILDLFVIDIYEALCSKMKTFMLKSIYPSDLFSPIKMMTKKFLKNENYRSFLKTILSTIVCNNNKEYKL